MENVYDILQERGFLEQVTDAEAAASVFELLMGSEVAPRRQFIVTSSDRLSRDTIDA